MARKHYRIPEKTLPVSKTKPKYPPEAWAMLLPDQLEAVRTATDGLLHEDGEACHRALELLHARTPSYNPVRKNMTTLYLMCMRMHPALCARDTMNDKEAFRRAQKDLDRLHALLDADWRFW